VTHSVARGLLKAALCVCVYQRINTPPC